MTDLFRRVRRLAAALFLLFGLMFVIAPPAQAGLSLCRSDPVVQLSDGTQVTLYSDIEANISEIENIHYELRVPAGLSVLSVEHPDPQTASLETFAFSADTLKNQFISYTTVTLHDGSKVKVRAYMEVAIAGVEQVKSTQKVGASGEQLVVSIKVKQAQP